MSKRSVFITKTILGYALSSLIIFAVINFGLEKIRRKPIRDLFVVTGTIAFSTAAGLSISSEFKKGLCKFDKRDDEPNA